MIARAAVLVALLLVGGCAPGEEGGLPSGPCEAEGERICASGTEFIECRDGEWTEPLRCPPTGDPPFEITTYCNDGGLCAP